MDLQVRMHLFFFGDKRNLDLFQGNGNFYFYLTLLGPRFYPIALKRNQRMRPGFQRDGLSYKDYGSSGTILLRTFIKNLSNLDMHKMSQLLHLSLPKYFFHSTEYTLHCVNCL